MTLDEFEQLSDEEKSIYTEFLESDMQMWKDIQKIAAAPYPQNILSYCYGDDFIIPAGREELAKQVIEKAFSTLLQTEREILLCVFRDRMGLEEMENKFNLTWFTVIGLVAKATRVLRHPSRSKYIMRQINNGVLE